MTNIVLNEPVRTVVGLLIVVAVVLGAVGLIDYDVAGAIVGALTLIIGGEAARSQVQPTKRSR